MQSSVEKAVHLLEQHQHQQRDEYKNNNSNKPSVGKLPVGTTASVILAKERRVSDTVMRSEYRPAPVTAAKSRRISAWTGPSASLVSQQLSEELGSRLQFQHPLRQAGLDQVPIKTASLDRLPVTTVPLGGLQQQSRGTSTNTSTSSNGDVRWRSGDTLGSTAELAVSFDQEAVPAQLACVKKVKGMTGRRQPELRSYSTEL